MRRWRGYNYHSTKNYRSTDDHHGCPQNYHGCAYNYHGCANHHYRCSNNHYGGTEDHYPSRNRSKRSEYTGRPCWQNYVFRLSSDWRSRA